MIPLLLNAAVWPPSLEQKLCLPASPLQLTEVFLNNVSLHSNIGVEVDNEKVASEVRRPLHP